MIKKMICAALAAVMTFSLAACGKPEPEPELTYQDKKEIVEDVYSQYFKNDFTQDLPFKDIFGIPLADLKNSVKSSGTWSEDTSAWSDLALISGYTDDVAYCFSNRKLNLTADSDGGLLSHLIAGGANLLSTSSESAEYVYVVTDGSSQERVALLYICTTNTGLTSEEIAKVFTDKYHAYDLIRDGDDIIGFRCKGLISNDIDYEQIYNISTGAEHKDIECCFGELQLYYADNTVILRIYPYEFE